MRFGLSEEQQMLQETVRGFIAGECPPARLRELFDEGQGNDPALWRGMAEMGLCGLVVPEAHGGAGMGLVDLALVAETLGEGAVPGPFFGHSLVCLALAGCDDEALRARWLPELASGERIGTVALCEADSVWEPSAARTRLADGRVSGTKRYVPHADLADVLLVGCAGGGFALVECAAKGGGDGVQIQNLEGIDRTRPVFEVAFDGAPGVGLDGDSLVDVVRDAGLVLLAADSFGAANALLHMTNDYAKTRQQFGNVIAQFQSVKHQLARMLSEIEPSRALLWYAAYALDRLPDEAARCAAEAKAHITDCAMTCAREAVELHGGLGFTWECDVQLWFKRAMFNRAFLGTPEVHRERFAQLSGW